MTNVTLDRDSLDELLDNPDRRAFAAGAAAKVAACALRQCEAGQGYGARKAWISSVAAELGLRVDRLASLLVLWQAAGLVSLCRADLVGAMDPALVQASEVCNLNASFHFIVVG
jgi:hypothetical protein